MFILFGEVSVEECSPVISVVAGSIDRPHLAANSKNHQEESQPCCHLKCGWSSVFVGWTYLYTDMLRLRWAQDWQHCFWLFTHVKAWFYPSGNWRHDAHAGLRDWANGEGPESQGLHLKGWFGLIDTVQSFFAYLCPVGRKWPFFHNDIANDHCQKKLIFTIANIDRKSQ